MDYQKEWDTILVYGWRADIDLWGMVMRFLDKCNNDLYIDLYGTSGRTKEAIDYITSLKLRRCRDRSSKDEEPSFNLRRNMPVRAFVAERSEQLSKCLWFDENKTEDILLAINNFKWTRTNGRMSNSRRRMKREKDCTKFVKAKDLSKKHDWNTIKGK